MLRACTWPHPPPPPASVSGPAQGPRPHGNGERNRKTPLQSKPTQGPKTRKRTRSSNSGATLPFGTARGGGKLGPVAEPGGGCHWQPASAPGLEWRGRGVGVEGTPRHCHPSALVQCGLVSNPRSRSLWATRPSSPLPISLTEAWTWTSVQSVRSGGGPGGGQDLRRARPRLPKLRGWGGGGSGDPTPL